MKICIVGTGYVGLVCGVGFAEMGNSVICVDSNKDKIEALKQCRIPIYEPGLEDMVQKNVAGGNLMFSSAISEGLAESSICFIAVGTPMGEDGSADIEHVLAVARDIGRHMVRHMFVVDKSTVPVGTGDKVRDCIAKELAARGSDLSFDIVANPEFLKEGTAVADFMRPDRIVVGVENERSLKQMRMLFAPFAMNHDKFIVMDIRSAELTKYAANAMLACKISFMNEMAGICELVGADINKIRLGIGSDSRIGYQFLYSGCGYGGSCFPKDVQALIRTASECDFSPMLIRSIEDVNQRQRHVLAKKVAGRFGDHLHGMTFGVWGLTFKPDTDDMREAPSLVTVRQLANMGASMRVYDPKAMQAAREFYFRDLPLISYHGDKYGAIEKVDALLLLTEWKEFRNPDFEQMRNAMRSRIIFDGRNQYDQALMEELGFEYHQIGVKSPVVRFSPSLATLSS